METTHVVTVFLRNDSDVLLLQRSEAVGSYVGRWGGVAGFAEGDPDAAARKEVREEAGIDPDAISLVRSGEPFTVDDAEGDGVWLVHPYLFDCATREVETDWETAEWEWLAPTAILRRETVPDLWEAYDAVRPTVETVRADREHGSAYLSVRALEVLRDEAALAVERGGADWSDLAATARDLRDARDGMVALANRVNRVMDEAASAATAEAVESAAADGIDRALRADEAAAARAADLVAGERVLTLSRSGTVRAALLAGDPAGVVVAESRPGGEGVPVAEDLADAGLDVTLTPDSAVAWLLREGGGGGRVDLVLVGADSVLPDGAVVNKVGTRGAALAAAREGVPVHAVCATDKVRSDPPDDPTDLLERADRETIYDGPADLAVESPLFDETPADLLAGVVTEDGTLDADGVGEVSEALRSLAEWEG